MFGKTRGDLGVEIVSGGLCFLSSLKPEKMATTEKTPLAGADSLA
jgi:hypothetical protein